MKCHSMPPKGESAALRAQLAELEGRNDELQRSHSEMSKAHSSCAPKIAVLETEIAEVRSKLAATVREQAALQCRLPERVRVLHAEAFAMRRANLVRVAAEPMDELPANRDDMYRSVPGPAESGDDDDDDDDDDAKRIDGPEREASLPSSA